MGEGQAVKNLPCRVGGSMALLPEPGLIQKGGDDGGAVGGPFHLHHVGCFRNELVGMTELLVECSIDQSRRARTGIVRIAGDKFHRPF